MRNDIADSGLSRTARFTGSAATGALVLMIRACALVLFMVMSMAEPFLAVVLSALAIGCFFVAVLFGFILPRAVSASLVCSGCVRRVLAVVRAVSLRDAGCTETAPVKMDATAFKLLERKRRFKPQTLEIAKRRILRREPATALAAAYGVNLQRIYTIENTGHRRLAGAASARRLVRNHSGGAKTADR